MYCDIIYAFAIGKSTRYLQHTDIHFHFIVRDNNSIVEIDHCDYCCCHSGYIIENLLTFQLGPIIIVIFSINL